MKKKYYYFVQCYTISDKSVVHIKTLLQPLQSSHLHKQLGTSSSIPGTFEHDISFHKLFQPCKLYDIRCIKIKISITSSKNVKENKVQTEKRTNVAYSVQTTTSAN